MNQTIAKAIIGNMLRRTRIDNGHAQREVAMELGLPNPNYLSMIEKGTNFIPLRRLWDFVDAYRLTKPQGLAAVKLSDEEMWKTVTKALLVAGVSQKKIKDITADVEEVIKAEGLAAGVELVTGD